MVLGLACAVLTFLAALVATLVAYQSYVVCYAVLGAVLLGGLYLFFVHRFDCLGCRRAPGGDGGALAGGPPSQGGLGRSPRKPAAGADFLGLF